MPKQDNRYKSIIIVISIACILALLAVVFPLLFIARYDYPMADDWSYGNSTYQVIRDGGNFGQVLHAAFQKAREAYLGWDGRFANDFLDSLHPGIWGEKYYAMTPWILIGMLIFSEGFLARFLVCAGAGNRDNNLLWLPIIVPALTIQILYTPSPTESFYWYTGGMNYTFMYGLSLILIVLFICLGQGKPYRKLARFLLMGIACVLAVFVGGGNFSTSLSTLFAFYLMTAISLMKRNPLFFRRTWFVTLLTTVCLAICLASPGSVKGNAARMTGLNNPLAAIFQSLFVSFRNIGFWTLTGGVLLMLLFCLPFIWKAAGNLKVSFKHPFWFTLLTFGVYASQVMPNIYVGGDPGGGRNAAIYYYSYIVWLLGNVFYWLGWLRKKREVAKGADAGRTGLFLLIYCGVAGLALVSYIYVFDKKDISSYKAYRDWRQGWAQQYAEEWEARLEVLHDEGIKEVVFKPLSARPETLMYTDLQEDDGYVWVNDACAGYYEKDSVRVSAGES